MNLGDVIEATVTRLENDGIWLEAEGWRGLLLITEIPGPVSHPSFYAKAGDVVTVKVLRFNPTNGDFVASRKAVEEPEPPAC